MTTLRTSMLHACATSMNSDARWQRHTVKGSGGAQGAGQAEAHAAEAAAADPVPRLVVSIPLRRPHLMLAHAGGDHSLPLRLLTKHLQHSQARRLLAEQRTSRQAEADGQRDVVTEHASEHVLHPAEVSLVLHKLSTQAWHAPNGDRSLPTSMRTSAHAGAPRSPTAG